MKKQGWKTHWETEADPNLSTMRPLSSFILKYLFYVHAGPVADNTNEGKGQGSCVHELTSHPLWVCLEFGILGKWTLLG